MKKRGFTLVELLAVIIILAVIALIATPLVLNVVDSAKKSAWESSAYGIIESVKMNSMDEMLDGKSMEAVYDFPTTSVDIQGEQPKGGQASVNKQGKVAIAIHNEKWCALKDYDDAEITLVDYDGECTLGMEVTVPGDEDNTQLIEGTYTLSGTTDVTNMPKVTVGTNIYGVKVSDDILTLNHLYGATFTIEYVDGETETWQNYDLMDFVTCVDGEICVGEEYFFAFTYKDNVEYDGITLPEAGVYMVHDAATISSVTLELGPLSSYDGMILPTQPDYDTTTYPYEIIMKATGAEAYAIMASTKPFELSMDTATNTEYLYATEATSWTMYIIGIGDVIQWEEQTGSSVTEAGNALSLTNTEIVSANYNIIDETDTVVVTASTPIKIYE